MPATSSFNYAEYVLPPEPYEGQPLAITFSFRWTVMLDSGVVKKICLKRRFSLLDSFRSVLTYIYNNEFCPKPHFQLIHSFPLKIIHCNPAYNGSYSQDEVSDVDPDKSIQDLGFSVNSLFTVRSAE